MTPTAPLKRVAQLNPEEVSSSTSDDTEIRYIDISSVGTGRLVSDPVPLAFGTAPTRARRVVRTGDSIISTVRPYLRAVATIPPDLDGCVASTGFAVLRPSGVDPKFLGWVLQSDLFTWEVISQSTGVSYPTISPLSLGAIRIPVPDPWQQRRIADYLNGETGRIDSLISAKRRLATLLSARVPAFLESLVTQLLGSPSVPRAPLKRLLTERDVRVGQTQAPTLLSVSIHRGVERRDALTDRESRADRFDAYKVVMPGDIVINRMRAFQGAIGVAVEFGCVSPDYTVAASKGRLVPAFAEHLMRSEWFVGQMTQRLRGIGSPEQGNVRTPRVRFSDLGDILVPVPDVDEQRRLAAQADRSVERSARLVRELDRQTSLLEEYRSSLITAAVEGERLLPGFDREGEERNSR